MAVPAGGPLRGISHLQRTVGNRGVLDLLTAGQAKLEVGAADDPHEREADVVARKVVAGRRLTSPSSPPGAPGAERQSGPGGRLADTVQERSGARRSIRRRLSFTQATIKNLQTLKGDIRSTLLGHESMWDELTKYMGAYDIAVKGNDGQTQVRALGAIEVVATEWLEAHGKSTDKSDVEKARVLTQLVKECDVEITKLHDHLAAVYENKLVDTNMRLGEDGGTDQRYERRRRSGKKGQGFKYITESATMTPIGTTAPGGTKIHQFGAIRAKLAGLNLTDAELAAIRVYSGGDYRTMNPTVAGSDAWLNKNVGDLTERKETKFAFPETRMDMEAKKGKPDDDQRRKMKVDAMMHVRLAVSGLKKLPDVVDSTYRGLSLPLDQLIVDYKAGRRIVYKPFTSTSTKRDTSSAFAVVNATGGLVPVLLTLRVNKGKDIKDISVSPKEGEVLLMPGAEFQVVEAPKLTGMVYEVTLVQVAQGGVPSGPVGPAVPINNLAPSQQVPPPSNAIGQRQRAGAAPAVPPGVVNKKATECAKGLIEKAKSAEPPITAFLQQLCGQEKGCHLAGLEHRFKTEASLARKLGGKATTRVGTEGAANIDQALKLEAAKVNDVLRYTMIAPVKTYREVERRVRERLRGRYKEEAIWDAWNGSTYKGLNLHFSSGGQIFEFQLHTKESFDMKQFIHEEYEEIREADTSPERKKALENYMTAKWAGVASPDQRGKK